MWLWVIIVGLLVGNMFTLFTKSRTKWTKPLLVTGLTIIIGSVITGLIMLLLY